MKTIYATEHFASVIKEVQELVELHYKQLRPYEDIPLSVDWPRMIKLQAVGAMELFTARKDGKLIGYATFFLQFSIDYSSSYQASMGNIFIHPDCRGLGFRFISWCDKQLKKMKVQVVYHHVKEKFDYGVLLKRLGYVRMNIEYAKRLDKE